MIEVKATPENLFWGYFDADTPPVAEINSGETVMLHTLTACFPEDLPPDSSLVTDDHKAAMEALTPGGDGSKVVAGPVGPHVMTGPIYVNGAEPGDTLQVDILEAEPRQDWGFAAILPMLGTLPEEFTDYERIHLMIDRVKGVATLPWGTSVPLDPFFGIMGVAPPKEWGRVGSPEPRAFGGNMDNKDLRPGSTLYLPVFNEGALFSAGDGHGCQGHGEVCITALETALNGKFRLTVRKDMNIKQPFAETNEQLISMGLNTDLDEAARQAVREMVRLVTERSELNRNQAYMLCSLVADLHVTQLVDIVKGIHMIMPKKYL
ncbi:MULTISPECIES: acetamidase/formamidase family protein [unclassified Thalassospira]|uniref:acetamidase/formamidase family protein n=1 Tax=unclassified Thalassospira TaxID=2648997 RepID=UPI0025CEBD55|nr:MULTISPECIES: acetamidase/formamidase family protein [unclassified Thalassospira]|tara:strand:+ start:14613 stop:15572 length:960 start_codon:yes stop_codon:yes gene_type:complete